MFRFENQEFLYLLILIPLFIVIYIIFQIIDKKRLARYCDETLLQRLVPNRSMGMRHLKFSLSMLALAMLVLTMANPQIPGKLEKVKREGVDIMICLDISNSMLAADIQPDRLTACKMAINRFIDKLKGDRIGLVVFAGKAFVQLPITTDYAAAKMFVNQVSPEMMAIQGTDISAALTTAAQALLPQEEFIAEADQATQQAAKVILLASDGEDHFPESIEIAKELQKEGFTIHTIGIGSTQGVPIPANRNKTQYKKDAEGNTVITRLNAQTLQAIAHGGHGSYVHATNANMGFEQILSEINQMEKTEMEAVEYTHYKSLYIYPLMITLLLLFVEAFLFSSKSKMKSWIQHIRRKYKVATLVTMALLSLTCTSCREKTRPSLLQDANRSFAQADSLRAKQFLPTDTLAVYDTTGSQLYQQALALYDSAARCEVINYNLAKFNQVAAHYRLQHFDTIRAISDTLLPSVFDKELIANVYYNKANAMMAQKQYQSAAETYKQALRRNPNDLDAKYNYVYAKKMAEQHGDGQSNDNSQNQDNQQDQSQQGQQDQKQDQKDQGEQEKKQEQQQAESQSGQDNKQQKEAGQQESAEQREQRAAMLRQLDALQQNERQTQQKIMIERMGDEKNKKRNQQEKDW